MSGSGQTEVWIEPDLDGGRCCSSLVLPQGNPQALDAGSLEQRLGTTAAGAAVSNRHLLEDKLRPGLAPGPAPVLDPGRIEAELAAFGTCSPASRSNEMTE